MKIKKYKTLKQIMKETKKLDVPLHTLNHKEREAYKRKEMIKNE